MLNFHSDVHAKQILASIDSVIGELSALRQQIVNVIESASTAKPIAIAGWLKDFRFTAKEITEARTEMWTRRS